MLCSILLVMIGRSTLEQYARRAHLAAAKGDRSDFYEAIRSFEVAASDHQSANAWLEIALLLTGMGDLEEVEDALACARYCNPDIIFNLQYEVLMLLTDPDLPLEVAHQTVLKASRVGGTAALLAGEHALSYAPRLALRCSKALSPDDVPISLVSRVWRLRAQTATSTGEAHAAWQIAIREANLVGRQRYLLESTHHLLRAGALDSAKQQFATLQQHGSLPNNLAVYAQVLLANIQFASGNPEKALELLRTTNISVGTAAAQSEAALLHADIAHTYGDSATEAQYLSQLVSSQPDLTERYVEALRASGNYREALTVLYTHTETTSSDLLEEVEAEFAYLQGNYSDAETIAQELHERTGSASATLLLARIAESYGALHEASEYYRHIVVRCYGSSMGLLAASEVLRINELIGNLASSDAMHYAWHIIMEADPWSPELEIANRVYTQISQELNTTDELLIN